jgi:DNA-directed RNA polymerase specialized sigma24 family protein
MVSGREIDTALCESLAARTIEGDAEARRALIEHLWPAWLYLIGSSSRAGSNALSEDDIHTIALRLVEKIGDESSHGLRLYQSWQARNPDKTFADWIRIVIANEVRDLFRERRGPKATRDGLPSPKRLLNEFATSEALAELGTRPPFTGAETARQLLEFAHSRLPENQLGALRSWIQGATFAEIGREGGLSPEQAQSFVRAALATLRRHFLRPASEAKEK